MRTSVRTASGGSGAWHVPVVETADVNRRSAKRILRAIVEPATGLAIVGQCQVLQRRAVGPELVRDESMRVTMPLHGFPEKFQCGFSILTLGHKGFQDFAFVIDGPPEGVGDTVDLYENRIQMPPPAGQGPHSRDPFAADLGGEHRAEAVPPEPHGFMADLDASLVQQVLGVAKRERVTDIKHHRQADDCGTGLEVPEGARWLISRSLATRSVRSRRLL